MRNAVLVMCLVALLVPSYSNAQAPPPSFVLEWGGQGNAPGKLNQPRGLGLDAAGNVYVADTNNNRVQVFTPSGGLIRTIGIFSPTDVAVAPNGNIYICNGLQNGSIAVTDNSGSLLFFFSTPMRPLSIAIDPTGQYVYVLLDRDAGIAKYDAAGNFLLSWFVAGSSQEGFSVALDGSVYIAAGGLCTVQQFSPMGTLASEWAAPSGVAPGSCFNFQAIAVDSDYKLYLSNEDGRAQIFTADGTFITEWRTLGNDPHQYGFLPDIGVNSQGEIYILDYSNSRVAKYAYLPTPTKQRSWGTLKMLYR